MNENYLGQINEDLKKSSPEKDQFFFGHGKLLISGEYFVLDGAQALALPTKLGQSLTVKYRPSFSPLLTFKSFDLNGECWFDHRYEFWHFKCLDENPSEKAIFIQKILQQVRKQNPHFLRDDVDVLVEAKLGFPTTWGLGSSSSLIYNIAQWAYVSPFELLFKTHGGSGYDIACAQSDGPILYKKTSQGPNWSPVYFNPSFRDNLYFVYQGNKRNSRDAVKEFNKKKISDSKITAKVTELTHEFLNAQSIREFMSIMQNHEEFIGQHLEITPIKESRFPDFLGSIKSLGAWGGDFVLVATEESYEYTKNYFKNLGLDVILKYDELISAPLEIENIDLVKVKSNNLVH